MASSKILLINPFLTPSDLQRSNFLRSRQNPLSISTTRIITSSSSSPALFSHNKTRLFLSPGSLPETTSSTRPVIVRSQLISGPLISPHDKWGMWTALFATSAFGIWSEKTKVGKTVSGAIVSILIGLAASNLGLVSCESPAYSVVLEFLLPLAVPLLLFRADLRRIVQSTGTLLLAFLLGSGLDSWLWLCSIITSSFVMFLLLLGIITRFYIYPIASTGIEVYHYSFKCLWDMFLVCVCGLLVSSSVFLWRKKQNDMEGKQVQNLEVSTPGMSPWFCSEGDRELESHPNQSLVQATKVHFGYRPNLKSPGKRACSRKLAERLI